MIILWILPGLALLAVAVTTLICFHMAFYVPRRRNDNAPEFDLPPGDIYSPFHGRMIEWIKEVRAMPCEEVTIRSFDGLTLWGKYYECAPGAPIELMFHGYRGSAERDLCGGVQRSFSLGHNVLIVDQRASGKSGGSVISFGVNESKDCHSWLAYLLERFGPDRKIILTGISMGAATVMMAAGKPLPPNVIGVLADCGYTSPKAIIKKVIHQMKLPADLLYPFVKLAARVLGRFDLEECSAIEVMQHCPVPVIFFHGETDDYVPCDMSRENFAACTARKRLVTMPETGHGMCYLTDPDGYLNALREFFG